MASIDCNKDVLSFHAEQVTLSTPQQDEMRTRRNAGRSRLRAGLARDGHPNPSDIQSQGSYAMRTMVQDDENEYDIDDGVYFNAEDLVDSDGNELTPLQARQRVCKALRQDDRLANDAVVKENCVRQEYPQGYHIDMPVYRVKTKRDGQGHTVEYFELASGDSWQEADGRAVTAWYNEQVGELNAGQSDGSQMRRVTKYTKKMARGRKTWKKKTVSGIIITKLVVDHFVEHAGRDDLSLRETWKAIFANLGWWTTIPHPVVKKPLALPGDAKVAFFRDCLEEALGYLEALDQPNCDRKDARNAWDDVFFTNFFSELPEEKKASTSVIDERTARRDDGGGRFG